MLHSFLLTRVCVRVVCAHVCVCVRACTSATCKLRVTHSQGLSKGEVGEEDVCLQYVTDVATVLLAELHPVQRDGTASHGQVARQTVQ